MLTYKFLVVCLMNLLCAALVINCNCLPHCICTVHMANSATKGLNRPYE